MVGKASELRDGLRIGWGWAEITPPGTVVICGQFHARVSEGVRDPLTATALAIESVSGGQAVDQAVMVTCDLVVIPNELRDGVRQRLAGLAGLDPRKVFLSATHTHTGPEIRTERTGVSGNDYEFDLGAADPGETREFIADRVTEAVRQAWTSRRPGGVSFGLGQALVGQNRRWTSREGVSQMYGDTNTPLFSHIEGWEDHAVNLLFTWDPDSRMTGVVANLACPSQEEENEYRLSADFWHDAREEIRRRHGKHLNVLVQCSAAGDQSPHPILRRAADARMMKLKGRSRRQELAARIAAAVDDVAPWMAQAIEWAPALAHRVETVALPVRSLTEKDVAEARAEAKAWRDKYDAAKADLDRRPELRQRPKWYVEVTKAWNRMKWYEAVLRRFEQQKVQPHREEEIHVLRLGDLAIATNPFEYYLDFGSRIIARSPAVQTFLVQLTGGGTYVPSKRSAAGGGYGSVPASNPVGPEGGEVLADRTVEILSALWPAQSAAGPSSKASRP